MNAWSRTLFSVVLVSLVSLVGILSLSLSPDRVRRLGELLVSFAVGALLGDAFIHLIPEAFAREHDPLRPSLLVLVGMLLFFLVEKALLHRHGMFLGANADAPGRPEIAAINVLGDAIHNFIDGVLIAASYLASPSLGTATTAAVLLHEIPQELGDFGVLVHSGYRPRKALLVNLASACCAIVGAVATLLVGGGTGTALVRLLVPLAAGGFVYIAAADLIPELQHDRSLRALFAQTSLIALGVALMTLLAALG